MGLDMFAYTTTKQLLSDVDFEEPEASEFLHDWRKHDALQSCMEGLYFEKGGTDEFFNGSNLKLDSDDLDRLENAMEGRESNGAPDLYGGNPKDSQKTDDLAFLAKARAAIAAGKSVYFSASW